MERKHHVNLWYFVAAFLAVVLFQSWWSEGRLVRTVPYSEFQALLEEGKLEEVTVSEDRLRGKLAQPAPEGPHFVDTVRVDPAFARDLEGYGVRFAGRIESTWARDLLGWVLPMVVLVAVWLFIIRRIAGQQGPGAMMSLGKSRAKIAVETDIPVTFDDVAGVDEVKVELREIVAFLKDPKRYGRLGARVPKGVLLVGPPGTGKTLLARAVAGEAGVTFFSINGSEFVELFVGLGAARVRDLFEQARRAAPCIIFVDELDALGRARGLAGFSGGADEKEQTLNQLLAELDGFDPSTGVVLLAATNRPEVLDPALLRAGRFDRQILVDRPDRQGRREILMLHLARIRPADDVDVEQLAALTPGFSGADLANLVNEAALLATRRNADAVAMGDFNQALERIVAGLEKRNRLLNAHERELVAHHETGHALVTLALCPSEAVHKISIIPRGIGALGYNIQRPTEDRFLMTRGELEHKMAALLAGRAAERLVFDELSTGAADDLDRATDIARSIVTRYGMDEGLGQVSYDEPPSPWLEDRSLNALRRQSAYSERTAALIDEAIRAILDRAMARATAVLEANRSLLEATAQKLLEKETLTAEELPQRGDLH